jgi:hypothetical protein
MKLRLLKSLIFFLGAAAALTAQVQTIDLGAHGKLTLYLLGDWKLNTVDMAGQFTVTINPEKEAVNATCTIAVTFPTVDRFDNKGRLKLRVEADNFTAAQAAVEGKAVAREFSLTHGYGFYCNLTDPELRGKPPQKGNYKNASVGKIRLAPDIVLDVSIMADGFTSEPYQQLLGAIEGMEFTPGRG